MDYHRPAGDIERRATEPSAHTPRRCIVINCTRLTQRSARNGLSDVHCKAHVEHMRRHGSAWRRSYLVRELEPYRKASQAWLAAHRHEPQVVRVVSALDALLQNSGPTATAKASRGKLPGEKARIVLARLSEAGKTGERLLLITLTIKATQKALGPRANMEFQLVQIAKMAHRLASGTHIRSIIYGTQSKYPRAEGNFMRILGYLIEDIAGIVADSDAVEEVLDLAGTGRRT
jgi:hypothetical protein